MTVAFTIPGPPVPKGRPRFFRGHAVTPKRTRVYEAHAKKVAQAAMAGRTPTESPVAMTIRFYVHDRRTRDLDNLAKAVTDAAKGVVYADDSLIWELHLLKALDRKSPRAEVEVRWAT